MAEVDEMDDDPPEARPGDGDALDEARERYQTSVDAFSEMRDAYLDDFKFVRLGEQWPPEVSRQRQADNRPCLTINRGPAFVRQVVNDGRQNRPQIKVRPVDSGADVATAEICSGLIKHIETISDADVAYDTALDTAASGGFGYIGVDVDYISEDSFDLEIFIRTISNPLAILGDANTTSHDSSDWNYGFETFLLPVPEFKKQYPGRKFVNAGFASDDGLSTWFPKDEVLMAKYFERVAKKRKILLMSDGSVLDKDQYAKKSEEGPTTKELMDMAGITVIREREAESFEIVRRLITGAEVLDEKRWRGSIIPIVPVYGDMFSVEGKRYSHSLFHDAKDAQRMFNYSRSTAAELISLAPKAPWVGPEGFADGADKEKWANANTVSWPTLTYKGNVAPQRSEFAGVPTGAMQEAANANEDMKQIIGMHDASMGMPSNERSGVAIYRRQQRGDIQTFHFLDNQNRAIRCVGRILIELIPQVYSGQRMIRILGQDGKVQNVQLGKPVQMKDGTSRIYDLNTGKYDVAVEAGPSYTTRREESAEMLTDLVRAFPAAAPIIGPLIVKMSDTPDGEKVTAMLETMMPPAAKAILDGTPPPKPGPPPEVVAAQQKAQADQQLATAKMQQESQLAQQKASLDAQLENQASENRIKIEQMQAQADVAVMREKAAADRDIARERAALEMQLKREEAQLAMELKAMSVTSQSTIAPGVQ